MDIHTTTRMAPAGVCIYCGGTDRLTEEHIIPYGLGGRLVLPEASCPTCSSITSLFEEKVLRGFMLDGRTAGNFRTRHPKKRPLTVSVQIKKEGQFESVDLPALSTFGFIQLPRLDRCTFLTGRPASDAVVVNGIDVLSFGKPPHEVAAALGTKTLQKTVTVDVHSFVRMLAKIGYSYAVASLGTYPREEIPVLPLILGKANDGSTWIGSADYKLEIEEKKPSHALELRVYSSASDEIFVALVKLFSSAGATGYEVVVRRKLLKPPCADN